MGNITKNTKKLDEFDRLFLNFGASTRLDLCSKMDVPVGTYDSWRIRGEIPWKSILKIGAKHNLNPLWIKNGEGLKEFNTTVSENTAEQK